MTKLDSALTGDQIIQRRFGDAEIEIVALEKREYPEETIFVVSVKEIDLVEAAKIGNALDAELIRIGCKGFVTVRKADQATVALSALQAGVNDPKVNELLTLLSARSRTSEV